MTWESEGDLHHHRDMFNAHKAKFEDSKGAKTRTSSYCITNDDVVDEIMDMKETRKTV